MRMIAILVGLVLISLLAINLTINRVVPFWPVKERENIALRTVELFWNKGVRLVWEGGYRENLSSHGLSIKIGIPVPRSPNMICVEISCRG